MHKITENDIKYCDALCYKFHKFWGRYPDEDQIQDAREWMCRAAQRYKPELSPKFVTYARWYILGAVSKEYVRNYNGYPKFSDVYYQGLQTAMDDREFENGRNFSKEYENKDLVEKLVGTMPKVVEIALRQHAAGENFTDMIGDLGYNTRQALAQKIGRWRKKQGIVKCRKAD